MSGAAGAPRERLKRALADDDFAAVEALLGQHPALLNPPGRRPAVTAATSVAMAERLLALGTDLEAVGQWWAPGFHTRQVATDVARLLVQRGAALTAHAAAGLGLTDRLEAMLAADPALVHAKGGDGCTPLHFARDVATAGMLLERGADIDARDQDHESTPAQWLIGDAPQVVRFLLERGAGVDIFLAAALGDRALAERLVEQDPGCPRHRIGRLPEFPPLGHKGRGGTIYQWTLAFNSYPHQIALLKGHGELFDLLWERSDATTRLLVSCLLARRREAEAMAAAHPGLVAALPDEDRELVARYCWETNTNLEAVRLMLDVGFPVAHPETSHGYSPLHNAAWSGAGDLVDLLLERGAPVDLVDPRFGATALGFAIHDCTREKRHPEGEFGRVAKALLEAGSPWEPLEYPVGDARIDEVLAARLGDTLEGAAMAGDQAAVTRLLGENPGAEALTAALAGAAKGGQTELCRRLLDAGARVDGAAGILRNTPLLYALLGGAGRECVALLLARGAGVAVRNAHGTVALHVAAWHGSAMEVVEALLAAGSGALVEVENEFGYTPLRAAEESGHAEIAERLRGLRKAPGGEDAARGLG